MANPEHLTILKQGVAVWNKWREDNRIIKPDLSGLNLQYEDLDHIDFRVTNLDRADLSNANLLGANLIGATMVETNLHKAELHDTNFYGLYPSGEKPEETDPFSWRAADIKIGVANLQGANLSESQLGRANLQSVNLESTNLSYANLYGANLSEANLAKANLRGADLTSANLIYTRVSEAIITGCRVFGISVWELVGVPKEQSNLIITLPVDPTVTVDNLEIAQFIYLLLNNQKIRDVIDTITTKVVLILGRFTDERLQVLEVIKEKLRRQNYVPILFTFDKPANRDVTETVTLLARMSRFIIADITDPRSIPQELQAIVPHLPSVPVQPIISSTQREYGMFEHFTRYPWVLPIFQYDEIDDLLAALTDRVIAPAEAKATELRRPI